MSLRAKEIAEVVAEVAPVIRSERIRRVYQPDRASLLFKTDSHLLLFSVHPRASRLCLLPSMPPTTPVGPFAQALRRHLESRRVLDLVQLHQDRAVALVVRVDRGSLQLIAELTGNHGNAFLLRDDVILSCLGPNRSHRRQNIPGHPYVPLIPHPPSRELPCRFGQDPLGASHAIRAHYDRVLADLGRQERVARVARPIRRALQRERRLLARLERDESRHRRHLAEKHWGDLILAQPHSIPARAERVVLPDLFASPDPDLPCIEIPLDPRLSAVQNATRFLARAAKGRRGVQVLCRRIQAVRDELQRLEQALERVESLSDAELEILSQEEPPRASARAAGGRPPNVKRKTGRGRVASRARVDRRAARAFASVAGRSIRVGRNAEGNHHLTFRMARGRDVWLHARDAPGSHVVLFAAGQSWEPDHESLLDAAQLARHYSGAKDDDPCDVQWTYVKHLRRGARPGEVYVAEEKTLRVRHDPDRLARLLTSATTRAKERDLLEKLAPRGAGESDPSTPSKKEPSP